MAPAGGRSMERRETPSGNRSMPQAVGEETGAPATTQDIRDRSERPVKTLVGVRTEGGVQLTVERR